MALIDNAVQGFHFDESSGNAIDSVGSNDGIVTGVDYSQTGLLDDAFGFDRVDKNNDVVADSAIIGDTTVTVMGWIKANTTGSNEQKFILLNTTEGIDHGFGVWMKNGDLAIIIPGFYGGTSNEVVDDNAWHSYMLTKNGTVYNLYVDGGSSVIATVTTANGTMSDKTIFGGNDFGALGGDNGFYTGLLDETVIFNAIKSTDDFAEFHNSGAGKAYPFSPSNSTIQNITSITGVQSITI